MRYFYVFIIQFIILGNAQCQYFIPFQSHKSNSEINILKPFQTFEYEDSVYYSVLSLLFIQGDSCPYKTLDSNKSVEELYFSLVFVEKGEKNIFDISGVLECQESIRYGPAYLKGFAKEFFCFKDDEDLQYSITILYNNSDFLDIIFLVYNKLDNQETLIIQFIDNKKILLNPNFLEILECFDKYDKPGDTDHPSPEKIDHLIR